MIKHLIPIIKIRTNSLIKVLPGNEVWIKKDLIGKKLRLVKNGSYFAIFSWQNFANVLLLFCTVKETYD